MEEQGGQSACSQSSAGRRGEAECQIRELRVYRVGYLLVSEGCLHNDAFKVYKTDLQVLWTEWRKLDVAG